MEHVRFGSSGLQVSSAWLGTATFGSQVTERNAHAILDEAAELGITVLDSASAYPFGGGLETAGRTEEILGKWLTGNRDQFIIASKFSARSGYRPWLVGNGRQHIIASLEATLRRLGTDYVDIYQAHYSDPVTPLDETLRTLDDLVTAGKVRYVGCSNFLAYEVARALERSRGFGWVPLSSVQPRYSLLARQAEVELFPFCLEEGLAVVPYNVLAGGLLTGKHSLDGPVTGTRFDLGAGAGDLYKRRYWRERELATVEALKRIAVEAGVPLPTLAIAWTAAQPAVTAPILGASKPGQLRDAVAGVELEVSGELFDKLNELSLPFKYAETAP